ncbi:MAG TPA: GNAT family N-acetyltransferase [Streptosporangiaceae bacterium]
MPAADTEFALLDGPQAVPRTAELQALHAEVYSAAPYRLPADADGFIRRFRVQCRQPGFVLAEARSGGYLVGYAAGMPLRPATSWWRGLTTTLPEEFITEYPGRTFSVIDLVVRAAWRRQGTGQTLHDLLLRGRREERATLVVWPEATAAHHAFQSWGWRKVARTRDSGAESMVADVLMADLSARADRGS